MFGVKTWDIKVQETIKSNSRSPSNQKRNRNDEERSDVQEKKAAKNKCQKGSDEHHQNQIT